MMDDWKGYYAINLEILLYQTAADNNLSTVSTACHYSSGISQSNFIPRDCILTSVCIVLLLQSTFS